MINFDEITNENKTGHSPDCCCIPDHLYQILIVGGSGSGKSKTLLSLISHQSDIDEIHLYAKVSCEPKYQFLINKRENMGINHYDNSKAFIKYSNDMQDL